MFLDNKKHKSLAFPAGEGADQLLRREADEGYASTASSVRQQTYKQQFENFWTPEKFLLRPHIAWTNRIARPRSPMTVYVNPSFCYSTWKIFIPYICAFWIFTKIRICSIIDVRQKPVPSRLFNSTSTTVIASSRNINLMISTREFGHGCAFVFARF